MEMETIIVHVAAITYSDSFDTSQHPGLLKREARELTPIRELGPANMCVWNFHAVQISTEITSASYSYCLSSVLCCFSISAEMNGNSAKQR